MRHHFFFFNKIVDCRNVFFNLQSYIFGDQFSGIIPSFQEQVFSQKHWDYYEPEPCPQRDESGHVEIRTPKSVSIKFGNISMRVQNLLQMFKSEPTQYNNINIATSWYYFVPIYIYAYNGE